MSELAPVIERSTILENQSYAAYVEAAASAERVRVEYIHGDIVMTPAPSILHQRIVANLYLLLHGVIHEKEMGIVLFAPVDVELAPEQAIVQPDVIFVAHERIDQIVREEKIQGAPDLLVEILSPSTARVDRSVKLQTYAHYGVSEYWIVNPTDLTVEVYTHHEAGYLVAGVYGPGDTIVAGQFAQASIAVDAIFPA